MDLDTQAAAMSRQEIALLLKAYQELKLSHDELAQRVTWFERQLFGAKSERRLVDPAKTQLNLGETAPARAADVRTTEVAAHRRRQPARAPEADDQDLRFDASVPVEEIVLDDQKDPAEYMSVGEKVTCRLAQRPGAYVVLRYVRKVYKRRSDGEFSCPPAPPAVFEKSCADVSFLAGMVIDKLVYHLPLYRQHQRLAAAGVHLARSTLTNYMHGVGALLEPVHEAQLESILASRTLAMDETPIKAGRKKGTPPRRGQMKTGYFWPIYGDRDEIAFLFAPTRGTEVVRAALRDFKGVLLTDGYKVYELFAGATNGVVHAQCWAHARRHLSEAEGAVPQQAGAALDLIAEIYGQEDEIRKKSLSPEQVLAHRGEHVKPLVDRFFEDLRQALREEVFLPTNPFTKAARYALEREEALRVFLQYPDVAPDTNHVERAIRPIALGRKNYLFCWTEIGAQYVGILQSLLSTCRIQGIDPYVYLVDVLQRVDHHPATDVALLTPRLWKEHFATNSLRSHIDRIR
jgi:transposase